MTFEPVSDEALDLNRQMIEEFRRQVRLAILVASLATALHASSPPTGEPCSTTSALRPP